LAKHHVDRVDLLQIDTEGYDGEILRMFLKDSVRPKIIHFESMCLGLRGYQECCKLLNEARYRVLTLGVDTIAYVQEDDSNFAEAFIKTKGIHSTYEWNVLAWFGNPCPSKIDE
jgi:hypothetical protein